MQDSNEFLAKNPGVTTFFGRELLQPHGLLSINVMVGKDGEKQFSDHIHLFLLVEKLQRTLQIIIQSYSIVLKEIRKFE